MNAQPKFGNEPKPLSFDVVEAVRAYQEALKAHDRAEADERIVKEHGRVPSLAISHRVVAARRALVAARADLDGVLR
jgi:hypothetical protein